MIAGGCQLNYICNLYDGHPSFPFFHYYGMFYTDKIPGIK